MQKKEYKRLLIKTFFVGLSLLLKTLPWWLKGRSEGKTIRFHIFILKLITDIQKKCSMKSASLLVDIFAHAFCKISSMSPVLSQRPNFLIPTLLFVARTVYKWVLMDRELPFLLEGTWVDDQVCVWHERWQHFSGCWLVNVRVQKLSSSLKFNQRLHQESKSQTFQTNSVMLVTFVSLFHV